MRTIEVKLYQYDELPSEEAKEKAREWFTSGIDAGGTWATENRNSIECFCARFGVTLMDWSVGAFAPLEYRTDAHASHFRGVKLRHFKGDEMPTGYCLDSTLYGVFHSVFKQTGDAKAAFDAAIESGFMDWRQDAESEYERENVEDNMRANEYEFLENGERA
jgi:hypothetical protein